jgi:hypothetical protein
MRQQQAHHAYHRKRMMMQKYAHAKKMYAEHSHLPKYPAQQERGYGGHMIEYGGLFFIHKIWNMVVGGARNLFYPC